MCQITENITCMLNIFCFLLQLDSRTAQYLEHISQLQLYEYQLDENLCPNVPSSMRGSFTHRDDESSDYVDDRSTCFRDEDPMLRIGMTHEGSKDNLRSENTSRSKDGGRHYHGSVRGELGVVGAVRRQVGLLAQEVERVLPNAVRVTVSLCACVCESECM